MVFDLLKLAYSACNEAERRAFKSLCTLRVDRRACCVLLIGRSRDAFDEDQMRAVIRRLGYRDGDAPNAFEVWLLSDARAGKPRPLGSMVCTFAAGNGHVDCLRDARLKGYGWDAETCEAAARYGHLDALRYARESGCAWDHKVPAAAAERDQLHCLRYALENGCPATVSTCMRAASVGSLRCLAYAHDVHACPVDDSVCDAAALNGRLRCLEYLRRVGCPWTAKTCMFAAGYGHLDVLKFAHRNRCPWDRWTIMAAACHGHLDVLKYAARHRCKWDVFTFRAAVASGNDECVAYLRAAGCPRDEWSNIVIEGRADVQLRGRNRCPFGMFSCRVGGVRGDHMVCMTTCRAMLYRRTTATAV